MERAAEGGGGGVDGTERGVRGWLSRCFVRLDLIAFQVLRFSLHCVVYMCISGTAFSVSTSSGFAK